MDRKISFFNSLNAPYYIYGLDYRQQSAGVRVLHYLCHTLNELGEEAYIFANVTSPYLRTPQLSEEVMLRHASIGRQPIAVYPEIVPGNPMQAPVVARWLLNKPGHIGGDLVHHPDELLFTYQQKYAPEGAETHPLYIPAVNSRIFNDWEQPYLNRRQGACYYAHKYLFFGGKLTHHAQGATSLCQDIPRSHEEIAGILRRSEVLYAYEPSAIVSEALQCGCPVVMVPSEYLTQNYSYSELTGPGVEIGMDEQALARAQATLKNLNVQRQHIHARITVERFVELTQQRMQNKSATPG